MKEHVLIISLDVVADLNLTSNYFVLFCSIVEDALTRLFSLGCPHVNRPHILLECFLVFLLVYK